MKSVKQRAEEYAHKQVPESSSVRGPIVDDVLFGFDLAIELLQGEEAKIHESLRGGESYFPDEWASWLQKQRGEE